MPSSRPPWSRGRARQLSNGPQRRGFPAASQGEFDEDGVNDAPGDFAESVAVEEEERSGAMTLEQEVERFAKG